MGENAAGPVEVNTNCSLFCSWLWIWTLYSRGLFSLPIHWTSYVSEETKISVSLAIRSAFCFGERRQLCRMSEAKLAPLKYWVTRARSLLARKIAGIKFSCQFGSSSHGSNSKFLDSQIRVILGSARCKVWTRQKEFQWVGGFRLYCSVIKERNSPQMWWSADKSKSKRVNCVDFVIKKFKHSLVIHSFIAWFFK